MSIAITQLHYIFGLKSGVVGNICFHDEQTIVYPAGANCVVYNIDQKSQKFIPNGDKSEGITALVKSPNHRYIAIAEKGERPVITVYDLSSLRKKRVLTSSEMQTGEFISMAFSPDSKYFVSLGGKPDWLLLYWTWEKGRVMAATKIANPQVPNLEIFQVSFCPKDNTQLCVVGNTVFRYFRYSEGNLKTFSFQKLEPHNYLCHDWISEDKVVVGTITGHLLLLETGEVKHDIDLAGEKFDADELAADTTTTVTCVLAFSNGFFCSFGLGTVYMYERSDDTFKRSREIVIPPDSYNTTDPNISRQQVIQCLALSPSEEILVVSTDHSQIYYLTFSRSDFSRGEQCSFEVFSQVFHSAPITSMDVCIRKSLIVTCSTDCSIRVWNFETCALEIYKVFAEEVFSIALHPSGLHVLAGFNDKLRLLNIHIDDLKVYKEFSVRGCRECAFSNGGHLFASVMGNVIQLYATFTFRNINNLKGHNGKVRSLVWSDDDSKLISCGMDGAVYEWDTFTGKRIGESVLKTCDYSSITVTPDGKSTFAVGSDKTLKEISDSRILREVSCGDMRLTAVALSHSGRMLFAGTMKGTVWSVKFPLTASGDWAEFQAHEASVSKMKIAFDDRYLVSVGEDGTVCVWKIFDKEGRGLKREEEISWSDEMLIAKTDLLEKNGIISELGHRVEQMKEESDYQLRLKDLTYNDKMTELTETFIKEMELLKTKNQIMKTDKDREETEHETSIMKMVSDHDSILQNLESSNNQKLVQEYEKFQEQQAKTVKIQEDYEKMLTDVEDSKEKALEALTDYYEFKLREINDKLEQANSENRQMVKDNEEMKRLIEEDCDRELLDIRHQYEKKLMGERDTNFKLRGENGIMKKRFNTLYKDIDDLKDEIKKLRTDAVKMSKVIKGLETDIQVLKKEIQDRDDAIQHKERAIFDLKQKNQELEKFRFVLDYKIKELREQIEPREMDIKNMKEQIQEMESELGRFHKQNIQLELTITELRQKLRATDKEMHKERQKVRDIEANVQRFKTDLHNCVGYIQDTRLFKEGIKALYQKHVQDDITKSTSLDADIQKEFTRQKDHLERLLSSLRKKLEKDSEIHKADNVKIMQENVSLIKDISDLRNELKLCRVLIHDMTVAMGLDSRLRKHGTTIAAPEKPLAPLVVREMEEQKKIIEMQQLELKRLRDEIYDLEQSSKRTAPHLPSLS